MYNKNNPVGFSQKRRKDKYNWEPPKKILGSLILLKNSYLDLSTFCNDFKKEYSQHRRFVKSISRLNYLQYINFDFGRSTFLTLTINDDNINDKKVIRFALIRLESYLRRKGILYYVIVKELGNLTNRLHYHLILFKAQYLEIKKIRCVWRIGNIKIKEALNERGGVFYLACYIKKGLNLQFSRSFFKSYLLRNDVYYLVQRDRNSESVYIDNVFNAPYITKADYRIFKSHYSSSELARFQLYLFQSYSYYKRLFEEVR